MGNQSGLSAWRTASQMLRHWGLWQRKGLTYKAAKWRDERINLKSVSLRAWGSEHYWDKDSGERWLDLRERWGYFLSAQVQLSDGCSENGVLACSEGGLLGKTSWRVSSPNQTQQAQAQTGHSWLQVPEKQLWQTSYFFGYMRLGGRTSICKTIKANPINEGRLQIIIKEVPV